MSKPFKVNQVMMPDGETLCTVPIEAALDCGHTFFGKYIEIIIGMLREHGAVVVFNADLDQFSLLQLGANLAANARFDSARRQDPGGDPAVCTHPCRNTPVVFTSQGPRYKVHEPDTYSLLPHTCKHPRLDIAPLRGGGGDATCPECGVTVLVDEYGFWSATSPVATVTDRQAAGMSPCGHSIDQLRYIESTRRIHCEECMKGAR